MEEKFYAFLEEYMEGRITREEFYTATVLLLAEFDEDVDPIQVQADGTITN